jgi:hypothetical protein
MLHNKIDMFNCRSNKTREEEYFKAMSRIEGGEER